MRLYVYHFLMIIKSDKIRNPCHSGTTNNVEEVVFLIVKWRQPIIRINKSRKNTTGKLKNIVNYQMLCQIYILLNQIANHSFKMKWKHSLSDRMQTGKIFRLTPHCSISFDNQYQCQTHISAK